MHPPLLSEATETARHTLPCCILTRGCMHSQICPSSGLPCDCGAAADVAPGGMIETDSEDKLKFGGAAKLSKPSREPIFPSELRTRVAQPLELPGKQATWYR